MWFRLFVSGRIAFSSGQPGFFVHSRSCGLQLERGNEQFTSQGPFWVERGTGDCREAYVAARMVWQYRHRTIDQARQAVWACCVRREGYAVLEGLCINACKWFASETGGSISSKAGAKRVSTGECVKNSDRSFRIVLLLVSSLKANDQGVWTGSSLAASGKP